MTVAVCINDKGKPNEIPQRLWIKEGRAYEVDWVGVLANGQYNVHLKHPELDKECLPYTGFSINRFRFSKLGDSQEADESVADLIKELGVLKDGGPAN